MKKGLVLLGSAALLAAVASADTYYYKGKSTEAATNPFTRPGDWYNAAGEACSAITDANEYAITNNTIRQDAVLVTNIVLHLGSAEASKPGNIYDRTAKIQIKELKWHGGTIYLGSSGKYATISADKITVDSGYMHALSFSSDQPTKAWAIGLTSPLVGDADQQIRFRRYQKNDNAYADPTNACLQVISGDNVEWKGQFDVRQSAWLALGSENAAGDPETARDDAIYLRSNARFAVKKGVTLNAARGIHIAGEAGVCFTATNFPFGVTDCSEYTLKMPIKGYGFTKIGPGTVTLAGNYTAGAIVVANGTLVLDESGTFPSGLSITVNAGAKLIQHAVVPNIQVTGEGTYEKDIHYTVHYDPATQTTTPLDLTSGDYETPLGLALSEAIPLPVHTALKLPVATLAATATTDDFTDATEKTWGLPHTSYTIETDEASGARTLYLNVHPVVTSLASFPTDYPLANAPAEMWSNNEIVQAGYDYLVLHDAKNMGTTQFPGDSLTFTKDIYLRAQTNFVGSFAVYGGGEMMPFYGTYARLYVNGALEVRENPNATSSSFLVYARLSSSGRVMCPCINATLSGSGRFAFTTYESSTLTKKGGPGFEAFLTADNSAFKGRLTVSSADMESEETSGLTLHFSDPKNLGGPMDSYEFSGHLVQNYSFIAPDASLTLNTANRGFYVKTGGIDVTNGVTMTLLEPLRVNGTLIKRGEGTLALGSDVTFGADGTKVGSQNALLVHAGAILPLTDAAVAGFAATFEDGSSILLRPGCGLVNGFTGTLAASGRLNVRIDASTDAFVKGQSYTLPICTLPATAADLSEAIHVVSSNGLKGELVKETVTLNDVEHVRYSAAWTTRGMLFILR